MTDRNTEARRVGRELVAELGSPLNFTMQLFLAGATGIVVPDHVFIVQGKIKGLLRHAVSNGGLAFDPHWPSIDVAQTAESLFSQKAIDFDMHINQTVARHFSSRVDPAMVFLPLPGDGGAGSGGASSPSPLNSSDPSPAASATGHPSVTARYFSKDGLFDVVGDLRATKATGVLMEYRTPIDGYHNLLRATFTPFLLVMEMRQCGISLKDNQVPLKYRVSTAAQPPGAGGGSGSSPAPPPQQQQQPGGADRQRAVVMHGRYHALHHHGKTAVEVPVPQSASGLVCDMLKALIDKREEGGEFVERCVAYFTVVSPKQVVFLWCSQINAMPLDHANQLSEAVTSLSGPQDTAAAGAANKNDKSSTTADTTAAVGGGGGGKSSKAKQQQQQQQQQQQHVDQTKRSVSPRTPPQKRLNAGAAAAAAAAAASGDNSPSKKSTSTATDRKSAGRNRHHQQKHPHGPMDSSHHHYHEKKHEDSELLSQSLVHDMKISPARDNDISAHSAYLKEQSFILRELPSSLTAMRDSDNAESSLARVRGAYKPHPEQQQEKDGKVEGEDEKQKQQQVNGNASSYAPARAEAADEDDATVSDDKPFATTPPDASTKSNGDEDEDDAPDPTHIRALATAAAARRVARVFGVKQKLPPLPAEMKYYRKESRNTTDYSASRTEHGRVMSLQQQRRKSVMDGPRQVKMQLAFEKAQERRDEEQRMLLKKKQQQPNSSLGQCSGEHDATQDEDGKKLQHGGGEEETASDKSSTSSSGNSGNNIQTTAKGNENFIQELPSVARAVQLMKDSEFDAALLEMHGQTGERFDTGMNGYLVDMPAPYLFSKFAEERKKDSERKGVLEELLAPGALRAQKRKERKAREAPPLELRDDDGMSFIEKTVSSKLSRNLLSSQLIERRNQHRRLKQQQEEASLLHQHPSSSAEQQQHHKKKKQKLRQTGGAASISDLLFNESDDDLDDHTTATVNGVLGKSVSSSSAGVGRSRHHRTGSRSSSGLSRSRQNSIVLSDVTGYLNRSKSQQSQQSRQPLQLPQAWGGGEEYFDDNDDGGDEYGIDEEEGGGGLLYPTSTLSAPAAGLSQDEMAKYTYTVRRIRALGQVIFQTAADLIYRSASRQAERRNTLEIVIPFGYRHLDQELRSVFHTLGLEEQSLDSMLRIAEFRDQHDGDGTSFGELALNTQIGEAESMFEDESLVRQSNGAVASVRDEWYSLEGGGSVVFLLRDAKVSTSRVEKRLVDLESELTPLGRFDSPLCSPKDVECCKRLCELVAERGFTICDAANVVFTERMAQRTPSKTVARR